MVTAGGVAGLMGKGKAEQSRQEGKKIVGKTRALAIVAALAVIGAGLMVFTILNYLRSNPPNINYAAGHTAGTPVNLTIETVGTYGHGRHPTWVSYLAKAPNGQWVHSTLWELPPNTKINVTVLEFDSVTPLRNSYFARVTGVKGGYEAVNGKRVSLVSLTHGKGAAHTFTAPALGINVPLPGISANAKHPCSAAPCSLSDTHNVIKFSFTTPSKGTFHWQCFIPCGAGYLDGNGGPMQSIGYMDGFLKVVS